MFSAVIACLKVFWAVFLWFFAWEKSMLLQVCFLRWGLPAEGVLKLHGVDGGVFVG